MSFWGWAAAIGAGWFTASVLLAVAWGLVGKRIFRKPPQPPRIVRRDGEPMSQNELNAVRNIMALDAELRGRGGER